MSLPPRRSAGQDFRGLLIGEGCLQRADLLCVALLLHLKTFLQLGSIEFLIMVDSPPLVSGFGTRHEHLLLGVESTRCSQA